MGSAKYGQRGNPHARDKAVMVEGQLKQEFGTIEDTMKSEKMPIEEAQRQSTESKLTQKKES
ncbi:E3 ubiquitin-protein ligase [Sesbania bispinosa]|nr:E3 ubiquitin-protein ligase [Sesbania bispinosa]